MLNLPSKPKLHDPTLLYPDIVQGLSGVGDALRAEIAQSIGQVFRGVRDWHGSTLTGDGFPFELCFHTGKDTLYWTADPAFGKDGPEQLSQIVQTAACLGDPITHPAMLELSNLGIEHRVGSWLGGRHDVGRPMSCKLYTDWTGDEDCRAIFPEISLPRRLPNGASSQVRGIGLGPGPSRAEIYYRFNYATPRHMRHILEFAGLSARASAAVVEAEKQAVGDIGRCLEASGMIASLSQDAPGETITVTFYFFPRTFWGNDRACRTRFLSMLSRAGRNSSPYAAASAPISTRVRYNLLHGLIALTITPDGMAWGVGIRPQRANFETHRSTNFRGINNG